MKKCPICGKEYEQENTCPSCGIVLINTETNSAVRIEPEKKSRFGTKKKKSEEPSVTADPFAAAAGIAPKELAAEEPVVEKPGVDESTAEESMAVGLDAEESKNPVEMTTDMTEELPESEMADPFAAAAGAVRRKAVKPTESEAADPYGFETGTDENEPAKPQKNHIFHFNPAYVVVAVVAVLLIVAVVFIVRGMKAKKEAEQAAQQYQMAVEQQEDGSGQEEEIDLSEVDVNTVDESYWEYTGEIDQAGAAAVLELEEPLTFYAYNADNEKTLLKNVHDVYIDGAKSIDISDYYGKETTVGGYLTIEGDKVLMEVMDAESDDMEDDLAIHEYRIVISDVSWSQAKAEAESAGGYLVRINSAEEYNYITNILTSGGYTKNHFYLGGRREDSGRDYYWVDEDNQFMGEAINTPSSWSNGYWYSNEPSYVDTGSDASGQIDENVMNLFYVNGQWYLNDSSADLVGNYPSLMQGKTGYIIELE